MLKTVREACFLSRDVADYRPLILLVGLVQLIVTTDFSIVSVALPSIGRDLQIPPASLSWVISAAALTFGGFLILAGRASDVFGQRRCLIVGLAIFGMGSLGAALAPSFPVLVSARVLQGLGGAILTPANFSLINTVLPEGAPRRRALGVFGVMQGLSLVIGLLIGGAIVTRFGWHAVFLLNPPIALAAIYLAWRAVPPRVASGAAGASRNMDWAGAVLIMAGMVLVLLGISEMGRMGFGAPLPLGLLAGGVASFALFFVVEGRARAPLAPLSIFAERNFAAASVILLLHLAGVGGIFVLANVYMQSALKFSAFSSGLGMMPYAAAVMIAGQGAPMLMARLSHRVIAIGGFAVFALGLGLLALFAPVRDYWLALALGSVISAFGSLTSFMAVMADATADVPHGQQGAASAILFTTHQIGVPLGATVALSVLGAGGAAPFRDGFLAISGLVVLALVLSALTLRPARAAPPAPIQPDPYGIV